MKRKEITYGETCKRFFTSIWDRAVAEPIPLNELVKLIISKDNSKNSAKSKDGNARKRIDRAIKYGSLKRTN